uniref:RNase H type-1 domain-containing protein n=1 Tax=Chenopodium quinoa TaxID=63459 RepID=A0A803N6H1_CHEQI
MQVRMNNLASLHPFINAKFDTSRSLGKDAKAYFCTDCGGHSLTEDDADRHTTLRHNVIRALKERTNALYCYKEKDIEESGEQVFNVHGIQLIRIRSNNDGTTEYGYIIKPLIIPMPESVIYDNEKSIKDETNQPPPTPSTLTPIHLNCQTLSHNSHFSFLDAVRNKAPVASSLCNAASTPPESFDASKEIFIPIEPSEYDALCEDWSTSLISKPCGKSFSTEFFTENIVKLWKPKAKVTSFPIGKGFFITKCSSPEDCDRILKSGPWFLNGVFISVEKWKPGFKPSNAPLNKTAIWVELHELPAEFNNQDMLSRIGNSIGTFIKRDNSRDLTPHPSKQPLLQTAKNGKPSHKERKDSGSYLSNPTPPLQTQPNQGDPIAGEEHNNLHETPILHDGVPFQPPILLCSRYPRQLAHPHPGGSAANTAGTGGGCADVHKLEDRGPQRPKGSGSSSSPIDSGRHSYVQTAGNLASLVDHRAAEGVLRIIDAVGAPNASQSGAHETSSHIFIHCVRAKEFWENLPPPTTVSTTLEWKTWISCNLKSTDITRGTIPWNVMFCFAIWTIWLRRNSWSMSNSNIPLQTAINQCVWAASEFYFTSKYNNESQEPISSPHWCPPPPNSLQINCAASFLHSSKEVGCAVVCRDNSGNWIEGQIWKSYLPSSHDAELKAIELALKLVKDRGWSNVQICSDAKRAVQEINALDCTTNAPTLLTNCRDLRMELHQDMLFEERSCNAVADLLAKDARANLKRMNETCILYQPPSICNASFVKDFNLCTANSMLYSTGDVPVTLACNTIND